MEFRRALRDEPVDEGLEREHWRRIAPLLRVRSRFAGAEEFLLYDCRDASGHVHEDVFAYSNRDASGAALVLVHNRWSDARGHIRWSAAYAEKRADGSRPLRQRTLLDGLGLAHAADDALIRCRDLVSGHEHLTYARQLREHGLSVELGPFASRVLLDWHEVARDDRPWDELARHLPAHGVPDLERALWELAVRPAQRLVETAITGLHEHGHAAALTACRALVVEAAARLTWQPAGMDAAAVRLGERLAVLDRLEAESGARPAPSAPGRSAENEAPETRLWRWTGAERAAHTAWLLLEACGAVFEPEAAPARGLRLFDVLALREPLANAFRRHGAEGDEAWRLAARVRALLAHADARSGGEAWRRFLDDEDARFAAGVALGENPLEPVAWSELPARIERATAPAD